MTLESKGGKTPLFVAIENGHVEIAEMLIFAGADVTLGDEHDASPLLGAIRKRLHSVVRRLLQSDALRGMRWDDFGLDPIHLATDEEDVELLQILIQAGAPLDIPNENGETALMVAARYDYVEIARHLIAGGASLNVRDSSQNTLVHVAGYQRTPDLLRLLIDVGADVNGRDYNEEAPLHSIFTNHYRGDWWEVDPEAEMAKMLIRAGADVNATHYSGDTPLMCACDIGYVPAVQALLETPGVEVNATQEKGWTALHSAARYGTIAVVEMLLSAGADVHIRNEDGDTPLMIAEKNEKAEVVALLEKHMLSSKGES